MSHIIKSLVIRWDDGDETLVTGERVATRGSLILDAYARRDEGWEDPAAATIERLTRERDAALAELDRLSDEVIAQTTGERR